ncbi:hypothetical protein [Parvibacter caecicola]|uniref:hypothetical protein n=1 Tax=Parvibacter caecicola TaxID=747645 RepID=UPI00248D0B89|nr:hypothetical protein [Parvibacter caecicola]
MTPRNSAASGKPPVQSAVPDGGHPTEEQLARQYLQVVRGLHGDEPGRWRAWERMEDGQAYYRGLPVAFDFLPTLFTPASRRNFASIVETTYGILRKVIHCYQSDAQFRKLFRFDPRVEELVLLPSGYEEPLPMARFRLLYNQQTEAFQFCEFNTDSSSGMLENAEACAAVAESDAFWEFQSRYPLESRCDEQFEGWAEKLMAIFRTTAAFKQLQREGQVPHVAIAVCMESPNPDVRELDAYQEIIEDLGWDCSIYDVRDLRVEDGRLVGRNALAGQNNVPIHLVWRFCIVVDLLKYWDEVQPFIKAVRTGAVTLVGAFSTQIAHDKQLFALLRHPEVQPLLTFEERAFVEERIPFTAFLDDPSLDLEEVRACPADWVLKPTDWYATKNVTAGAECTTEQWNRLIDEALASRDGSPYLVQRFVAPATSPAIPLYGREADFTAAPQPYGNLFGLYCHCGQFAGVYVRQGPQEVIGSAREGLVAPVFWLKNADE